MEGSQLDKIYADIIDGILAHYCKEKEFESYSDYEFIVFYATKNEDTKKVGALCGTLDQEFVNGIYTILDQISGGQDETSQDTEKGFVDL